jgi:hypothetical protein
VNLFQFLVIKTLDPVSIRIRIGIQPKMLDKDPDPDSVNPDPKHWERQFLSPLVGPFRGLRQAPNIHSTLLSGAATPPSSSNTL